MGLLKEKEGTGGAQFEVIEVTTPVQLVQAGELETGMVVYDAETKKRVEPHSPLQPGKKFWNHGAGRIWPLRTQERRIGLSGRSAAPLGRKP